MQALIESRLLSNSGDWSELTFLQLARLESMRSRVLRIFFESYRGQETSISDEKIRKEAKVPPVCVLIMARRLQLAARISRRAPPVLFALLQRDRSPWKKKVLVDLCHLRETMLENPVATVLRGIVLPCLSETVPLACQSGSSLGQSCGALQTGDRRGPGPSKLDHLEGAGVRPDRVFRLCFQTKNGAPAECHCIVSLHGIDLH